MAVPETVLKHAQHFNYSQKLKTGNNSDIDIVSKLRVCSWSMPTWMALTDVTCYVEAARHKAAFVESEKSTLDETVVFRDENLCDIDLEEARHSSPWKPRQRLLMKEKEGGKGIQETPGAPTMCCDDLVLTHPLLCNNSVSQYWCLFVCVQSFSCVWFFVTPGTVACQAPPSMGFSRQEYLSRVPLPSPKLYLGPLH